MSAHTSDCWTPSCSALEAAARLVGGAYDPLPRLGYFARHGGVGLGPPRGLFVPTAVGDVEDDAVEPFTLVPADRAPTLEDPALVTGRREHAVFELELAVALDRLPHVAFDALAVVGMDQRHEAADAVLDEVVRWVAGDALDLIADQVHRPVRVEGTR
jgi:hypothetical protein